MRSRLLACLVLGVGAAACVPIYPLDLEIPDAVPSGCTAATDCAAPGVEIARCAEGLCVILACVEGARDADGDPANGCEACEPTAGPDGCDGVDSDCDGRLDEDGDGTVDACGACDIACEGPDATYACRDGVCVVEACAPERYAVGGPEAGCPCALDAVAAQRIVPRRLAEPIAPRLAYPGDGRPGALSWVTVEGNRHVLYRWGITADGHPLGEPAVVTPLDGPHDMRDAWYAADGDLVAIVTAPAERDSERVVASVGDGLRVLTGDCVADRCVVVRMADGSPGVVRLVIDGDRFHIRDPEDSTIAQGDAPADGPEVTLVDAACLTPDRCIAVFERDDERTVTGIVDQPIDPVEDIHVAVVGERIWLAGRLDGQLMVVAVDGAGGASAPQPIPIDNGRAPRLLPVADGAWLVAQVDGAPVAVWLDAGSRPVGEARRISGGLEPVGMATPDLFFEHAPRAGTVERLVWAGLPDPRPAARVAPIAVDGQIVYRGRSGVFSVPADASDGPLDARLLLRRLDTPDEPPAAALVDGRPYVVDAVSEGLAVVDLAAGDRRVIGLRHGEQRATVRPTPGVALTGDGRLAVVAVLADGQPAWGLGRLEDPEVELTLDTGVGQVAPRLVETADGVSWLVTRAEPGVGYETIVRRVDGGPPFAVARRFSRPASVAAVGDHLLLAWLDRRTDRCGPDPDVAFVLAVTDGAPAPPRAVELPDGACPVDIELTAIGGAVQGLLTTADGLRLLTLDGAGEPVTPPVDRAIDVEAPATADGPSALVWSEGEAVGRVALDCRPDAAP